MSVITETGRAKLNLTLHITGKRPDGYHLLESLVMFARFSDQLSFYPSDTLSLEISGSFSSLLSSSEDNLVLRAASGLKAITGCDKGARILLEKHIPVGAGLGGGSADAAAALRGLMTLWDVHPDSESLHRLCVSLGSDVPVCMGSRTSVMTGVGDQIKPLDIRFPMYAVLVNPRVSLLTAEVYKAFSGNFSTIDNTSFSANTFGDFTAALARKHNALEAPALSLQPVVADVLACIKGLDGCVLARMSGSGATCFGLFATKNAANHAAGVIQESRPAWWVSPTYLGDYGQAQ